MIRLSEIKLPLDHAEQDLRDAVTGMLGIDGVELAGVHVHKRSYDARKRQLMLVYIVDATLADPSREAALLARLGKHPRIAPAPNMNYVAPVRAPRDLAQRPVVVGFGPCGIFAALVLAQMGFCPIVLERGKPVRERTKDTWGLWRKRILNPESNVQFGEGGAGTFSDGKLYSQIKDPRHLGRKVMNEFVAAGAPPEILYEAHPHIGTFKLVKVVENLRAQIIALGGEIRFQQRVVDVIIEREGAGDGDGDAVGVATGAGAGAGAGAHRHLRGLVVQDLRTGQSSELRADHVVMALGHSSRDTFAALHARGVFMESKPFSVGFRIEHPQGMIDRARLGEHAGHPLLGAADYKLVHHASNGRSVYSFCMCPGGTVVAATSEVDRVVTNGMSQYSRNERNANAGIVVGIDPADYPEMAKVEGKVNPLAGIVLQRALESRAFELGGGTYEAPGQLVGDFLAGRPSTLLGDVLPSYKPGVKLGDLSDSLPDYAIAAIREAIPVFGRKIKGFDRHDAVFTGVETRTSSPLRITRGNDGQSLNVRGLYPAGEGAGYAGGILSAGVDGIKTAEALARCLVGEAGTSRVQAAV
jgi:uncharacterized FAD-dependent dehydrogenase